jgi:hypothetical protein
MVLLASYSQTTLAINGGCDCSKAKFITKNGLTAALELCGWYMGPKDQSKPNDCLANALYKCQQPGNPKSYIHQNCNEKKCNQSDTGTPFGVLGLRVDVFGM